jgi:hypothetical protein
MMQLLAAGNLEILIPSSNQTIHMTGTWKILDDGRLRISQEGENGEKFERPAIIVFSLKEGSLFQRRELMSTRMKKRNQDSFLERKNKGLPFSLGPARGATWPARSRCRAGWTSLGSASLPPLFPGWVIFGADPC